MASRSRVEARFPQDPVQRGEFVRIPDAGYHCLPHGADRLEAQQRHVVLEREAALPRGVEDLHDPALEYRRGKVVVVHLEHRVAELQEERYPFRPVSGGGEGNDPEFIPFHPHLA